MDLINYCVGPDGFGICLKEDDKVVIFACVKQTEYKTFGTVYELNLLTCDTEYKGMLTKFIEQCKSITRQNRTLPGIELKLNTLSYNLSGFQWLFNHSYIEHIRAPLAKSVIVKFSPKFKFVSNYDIVNDLHRKTHFYRLDPIQKNPFFTDYITVDNENFYRTCYFNITGCINIILYDKISCIPDDYVAHWLIRSGSCETVITYYNDMLNTYDKPMLYFTRDDVLYKGKLNQDLFLPF